jgi:Lrp/AsnC family transcriptional regulator of lysine biosynthesis
MVLDDVDRRIIEILKRDGRKSFLSIARDLGISEAAVRKRVKRLVDEGYIRKFTVDVDLGFKAFVLVSVSPEVPCPDVAAKILEIGGVDNVFEISGQYDILVEISAENYGEANKIIDIIRSIRGVKTTYTLIVLRCHYK